jgi:hypothetical protein
VALRRVSVRAIRRLAAVGLAAWTLVSGVNGQTPRRPGDEQARKPNIAVSGCLMRQGYGTLMVADANVDGFGDDAERSKPGASNGLLANVKVPPRWLLDEPGAISKHVGEKVQVLGRTEWTPNKERPAEDDPAVRDVPHLTVYSVIVITSTCS